MVHSQQEFVLWAPMSIIAETYGISFLERVQNTSLLIATTEWEWVYTEQQQRPYNRTRK